MNQERQKGDSQWEDPEVIKNLPTIRRINVADENCEASGLPIISDGHTAYVDNSDAHTLIYGNTGSKKTRLFGMPLINMFAQAGESFIATDPKGELYKKTSGLAHAKGYNVIVLNFRELTKSSFWNPLKIPYELYHNANKDTVIRDKGIAMINDFITALAEPQRQGTKDPYFIGRACPFALAYLLFFMETATPEEANIFNFVRFFEKRSSPDETEEIVNCITEDSIAEVNLQGVLKNKDAKTTFGNIASCVSEMIGEFIKQKTLCQMLSRSSFDIRNIGKEKTAVYIIVPDEKTTLHFLVTAFIKQTYEILIGETQQQETLQLPVRLNFLLDEFGNIPAIPDMQTMITAARSRNMRFFLMVQGMYQLEHKYGKATAVSIKGNCDNLVFLASREYELLSNISLLCGDVNHKDSDGNRYFRPLISISDLQRLKKEKGETLILHGRLYPYVTELPDIDEYAFKSYPAKEIENHELPQIIPYNVKNILQEIKDGKRPLPFSAQEFDHDIFYKKDDAAKKGAFDW